MVSLEQKKVKKIYIKKIANAKERKPRYFGHVICVSKMQMKVIVQDEEILKDEESISWNTL